MRYAEGDRLAPAEYRALRAAAGWSDPDLDDAALERALASTWNVTAREDDGDLIGMGRVQDDGLYASIWDMIVLPEHRCRGIGSAIFGFSCCSTVNMSSWFSVKAPSTGTITISIGPISARCASVSV